MKNHFAIIFLTIGLSQAALAEGISKEEYEKKHHLYQGDEGDDKAINRCLANWNNHPFKNDKEKRYRVIETSVKVLGVGSDINDNDVTSYPQLILIKPSVKVLSKTSYRFANPNGWYCFKSNVTVLGKSAIGAHCNARIADSTDSVEVLGKNDGDKGGITVLGKTEVTRFDCK